MAVDSTATFKRRALQIGLNAEDVATMHGLGWSTYGTFAMASQGQPGQVADDKFTTSVITKVLGDAESVRASALKRLYLESYSACLVDIKRTVENNPDEATPKVPEVEKIARMEAFQRLYPGTPTNGIHEPASSLIDEFVHMVKTGHLKYLEWGKLLSREDELAARKKTGLKQSVKWVAEAGNIVATSDKPEPPDTALTSDYLVRCALHRRGIAAHVAGLMDFLTHESASELFFKRKFETCPPGYGQVSFDQIQQADERLWMVFANSTRGGTTEAGASVFPANDLFKEALRHPDVDLHLRPLPSSAKPLETKPQSAAKTTAGQPKARARSNQGGSDQQQKRRRMPRMPDELRGCLPATESGASICFAYNLPGGCNAKVPPGARCGRGLHVCCRRLNGKACGAKHSAQEHKD